MVQLRCKKLLIGAAIDVDKRIKFGYCNTMTILFIIFILAAVACLGLFFGRLYTDSPRTYEEMHDKLKDWQAKKVGKMVFQPL